MGYLESKYNFSSKYKFFEFEYLIFGWKNCSCWFRFSFEYKLMTKLSTPSKFILSKFWYFCITQELLRNYHFGITYFVKIIFFSINYIFNGLLHKTCLRTSKSINSLNFWFRLIWLKPLLCLSIETIWNRVNSISFIFESKLKFYNFETMKFYQVKFVSVNFDGIM